MQTEHQPKFSNNAIIGTLWVLMLLLLWRVLVTSFGKLVDDKDMDNLTSVRESEEIWREKLRENPTDTISLLILGLELERNGWPAEARKAVQHALRLAPADQRILRESAGFYLRTQDDEEALAILRRVVSLYPEVSADVWPVLVAELESGLHDKFFLHLAREDVQWWPAFFAEACARAADAGHLLNVFLTRVEAGLLTDRERSCFIGRMQRERRWVDAYQLWMTSLPNEQRRRVDYVFNGDFESKFSNLGFDWITPVLDGVVANEQGVEGGRGRRALNITFIGKRFTGPPIYQYLVLPPGHYQFEGLGRADELETWLGLQWGLYCLAEAGEDMRQLAKSDRFLGSSEWTEFRQSFTVPADCDAQVLQLELANPRADADTPGKVAARLRGAVWFDELKVHSLD